MNPYYLTALLAVVDLVSLVLIIRHILKSNKKKKALIIAVTAVIFISADVLLSYFYISANMFYDRDGNSYKDAASVVYYDADGLKYTLQDGQMNTKYFVSTDGTRTMLAERVYIDSENGSIVLDKSKSFKKSEKQFVYTDGNGREYYKFDEVKWDRSGKIKIIDKK